MTILVLGGTQFVGRHIVETLLHGGHSVTILNRGVTTDALPGHVERLRGDRDAGLGGLAALADRTWDVCVDVSGYTPRQVRPSTERLRRNVGRYVFISAVSVYGDPTRGPVSENQPRSAPAAEDVAEITQETYGPLKVTCEDIVAVMFPGRCALLRPQVIAGAHDPLSRFGYWVARAARGGEMLAPGDGSDYVQYIDAGDLARFARIVCEQGLDGALNLAGPRLTWAEFVEALGAQSPVWVPKESLRAAGMGERELPLYRPTGGPRSSLMHICNARAIAAGLTLTAPEMTIAAVRIWLRNSDQPPALSPEREAALLLLARSRA